MVPLSPFRLYKIITLSFLWSSSWSIFSQLYHPCTPALYTSLLPSIPSSFSFHLNCLSFIMSTTTTYPRESRMSSFLTLSILDTPCILRKHTISQACNMPLLHCPHFASVKKGRHYHRIKNPQFCFLL